MRDTDRRYCRLDLRMHACSSCTRDWRLSDQAHDVRPFEDRDTARKKGSHRRARERITHHCHSNLPSKTCMLSLDRAPYTLSSKIIKSISTIFDMRSPATITVTVGFLWMVVCCARMASCSGLDLDMDSELVETETGWQFGDDDIQPFDNATAPAPAPAVKVKGDVIPLINGDFELTNVTGNTTVLADATSTAIINWLPGGAGVQIVMGSTYNMAGKTKSLFAIHLNNPVAVGNGTQGTLSTTLAAPAATGKSFTVQYDTARMPDGPINLWSALKVSAVEAGVVNAWVVKTPVYNVTDAAAHITWQRQSFVYTGTGAQTIIKFESMSEKFGPIIDNVVIMNGKHELAAAPLGKMVGLCQSVTPFLTTAVALTFYHHSHSIF